MSENESVSFNGNGESQDVSQPNPQGQGTEEQEQETTEYLTRQEAQRLVEQMKDEVLRQTQSLTDKATSRLDKKLKEQLEIVNDVIELQKKAGITVTPEQERALRQEAYDKAFSTLDDEERSAVSGTQPQRQDEPGEAEKAQAAIMQNLTMDVYKEAGVELYPGDPEVELIDYSTPAAFLKSLRAAAGKKKQRIETPAGGRITSLAQKGQQKSLEAQYLEEKAKIQGDVNALIELKKKYKAKGLQV